MDQHSSQQLLNHMGIDVWYLRGQQALSAEVHDPVTAPASAPDATAGFETHLPLEPDTPAAPVIDTAEPDQVSPRAPLDASERSAAQLAAPAPPLQFRWLASTKAVYLYDASDDPLIHGFLRDVMRYVTWRLDEERTALQTGEFNWPQLLPATGDPSGSLRAFFDKQQSQGVHRVLCDRSLADRLQEWSSQTCLVLPDATAACIDSSQKQELWMCLHNTL